MARALGMDFTASAPGIWNDLTPYWFRNHAKRLGLKVIPLFGKLVPGRFVYPLSMALADAFGPRLQNRMRPFPYLERPGRERFLRFSLARFSDLGKSFDIPLIYHGVDQLLNSYAQHGGMVLCSIHLPLTGIMHGALFQLHVPTAAVLNPNSTIKQYVFGHPEAEAPEILETGPSLFFQARTALRDGRAVLVDIDRPYENDTLLLHPGFIRFAALNQTPVFFYASRLSGSHIDVFFSEPHSGEQLADLDACLLSFRTFMSPFVREDVRFCWDSLSQ